MNRYELAAIAVVIALFLASVSMCREANACGDTVQPEPVDVPVIVEV